MDNSDCNSIDERIFRYLKGQATPEEAAELRAWRNASPENEAHFSSVERLLRLGEEARASRPRATPPSVDVLTGARSEADARVIPLPVRAVRMRTGKPVGRLRFGLSGGAIAAAIVLAIVLVLQQPFGRSHLVLSAAEYITGDAETALVRLGDGSVVRLAPNSRLAVLPSADRREVHLDGRAFFAVAEDKRIPFIVQTPSGSARVLGTRFDIEARDQETRVIVVEGRVQLSTSAGEIELRANELSMARTNELPRKTEVQNVQPLLEWLDAFIVFQATPLQDVANEIESRFGIEVRITDRAMARETVTGWSNSKTAADILTRVCLAVNARCELSDTLVVFEPRR